jgi:hypothetical protein
MDPKDREHFIDEWLERALKRRGTAEPRPGLENRILAGLKGERERITISIWSWRPVWVSLAVILVVGVIVSLRRSPENIGSISTIHISGTVVSKSPEHVAAVARKSRTRSILKSNTGPRLEQFPSPQPLSQQEKILARYIQQFPREAVLVAQAQTQLTKQEMIERETSEGNR